MCVQKPTFLDLTSPWGGSEVMLLRNTLIREDNGAAEISQGAVLSRMGTNAIFSFYFLIDRLISQNCFRPQPSRRETKKSEVNTQNWRFLPGVTIQHAAHGVGRVAVKFSLDENKTCGAANGILAQ